MLTFRCARTRRLSRSVLLAGATLALSALLTAAASPRTARAQGTESSSCIGAWTAFSCVNRWGMPVDPYIRVVPQPTGQAAQARANEREHRWAARCRPVLALDRYGIARYRYAKPGCGFGVNEN